MLRQLLSDSLIYTAPALLSRGLSIFLIPLYTRVLSPADYGSLDLFLVFSSLVSLTLCLEVYQGLARAYIDATTSSKRVLLASSALWFSVGSYLLFSVVMLVNTSIFAEMILAQAGLEWCFRVGIIYIAVNGIFYLIHNQFRWQLRSREYALVSFVHSIATAGLCITFTYFMDFRLLGFLVGMLLGSLSAMLLAVVMLRGTFEFVFCQARLLEMLKFSTPLVLSSISIWASLYIDRLMISYFMSVSEVGIYGIGNRFSSVIGLLMVGFQGALTPLIYANYKNPQTPEQISRIFRAFVFLSIMSLMAIFFFRLELLRVFTTPDFYAAAEVIPYLASAILLNNMYIFFPGVDIARKTTLIIWISLLGCGLNIVLNIILIPPLGLTGAALATLLSCSGALCARIVASGKFYPVPHRWRLLLSSTGASAVISVGAVWLVASLKFDSLITTLIYLAVILGTALLLIGFGMISRDEINSFRHLVYARLGRVPRS